MNKKILKKALCLILVMSSITTWAQNSNKDLFYYNSFQGINSQKQITVKCEPSV